jgi:hypothetical protein
MNHFTFVRAMIVVGLCSCIITTRSWAADKDQSDIEKRIDNSAKVLDEIMATPDKGIPDKILSDAKCIAIIPFMVKIAVGFGGSHGKGVATCSLDNGVERFSARHDHGRQLGPSTWRPSRGSCHARHERRRNA